MSLRSKDPVSVLMVDGQPRDPRAPALPAYLPGVLRGEGIFEAFLVQDGVPTPFLAEHAARLQHSGRLLAMALAPDELRAGLAPFAPYVPPGAQRVRYTVFRGLGDQLLRVWIAGPREPPPEEIGLHLSRFRRDPEDPIVSAKTVSRAGAQRARALADAEGCWEALFPTIDGALAECTSSNLFLYRNGRLETPGDDQGILGGVTRGALLRAAAAAGLPVTCGRIPLSHLAEAAEVYVTNAVVGIIPVRRIPGVRNDLPGASGSFLGRLRQAYAAEWARALAVSPVTP